MIPINAQTIVHWQRPATSMVTPCGYRLCRHPALRWPSPALSITVQIHDQSHILDFYGCSDAHQQALSRASECALELRSLQTGVSTLARRVIHLSDPKES